METLKTEVKNKFVSRIDFNKNRQDMLNLQHMGDNDTEFSMMSS